MNLLTTLILLQVNESLIGDEKIISPPKRSIASNSNLSPSLLVLLTLIKSSFTLREKLIITPHKHEAYQIIY